MGPVEGGIACAEGTGGEKTLLGRPQNEGGVEAGVSAEMEVFLQPGERKGDAGAPALRSRPCGGADSRQGLVSFVKPLEWRPEETGPPATVGCEIELEIAARERVGEEELGDVEFPEFGLKLPGAGIGMAPGGEVVSRDEVEGG